MMPPLVHVDVDGSEVVVVHVRAGSEYNALLYLLQQVSRHFGMDDVLPDLPAYFDDHIFDILRFAPGTYFLSSLWGIFIYYFVPPPGVQLFFATPVCTFSPAGA